MSTRKESRFFIDSWATAGGERALIVGDHQLSYAELDRLIDARCVDLGDTRRLVLIESENQLDPLVTYLAALRGRHVVMMVPPGPTIDDLVASYRPDTILRPSDEGWVLDHLRDEPAGGLHPDLALLLSTSGSTGVSKFVRLSRSNLESNAEAIADYLSIEPTDCALLPLPLHYCYGLSILHSHLLCGAAVVVTDRSVVDTCFWTLVDEHQVTTFPAVPFTFDLLDRIDFASKDVPSLRYITQAGGKLAPEAVERYARLGEEKGFDLVVMYGATEATARMAYLPPHLAVEHPRAIGQPIPGGEFELADDGELLYSGPNVMMGYAMSRADLSAGADVDVLHTGDLATRNDAGLYEITGRKSRFLKLFGLRVSLDAVEGFLADGADGSVAATGTDEQLVIAVEGGRDTDVVCDEVVERFGLARAAVAVIALPELPRLANGKTDYMSIRELNEDSLAKAVDSVEDPMAGPRTRSVSSVLAHAVGRAEIADDETFVSLGGDSLSYVEVSIELEDLLGHVPAAWHLMTVAELEAARTERGRLREVETGVAIRALAILAIMAQHFELLNVLGGAHVLLAAAGFNFSRFTLGTISRRDSARPIIPIVVRIMIPTTAWVLLVSLMTGTLDWSVVTYVSHLDPEASGGYWFIEVLVQILVVAGVVFSIPKVRALHRVSPYLFAVAAMTLALYLRYGIEAIWSTDDLGFKVLHMSLWLFAIGWVAEQSRRRWQRWALTLVTLLTVPGFFDSTSRTLVILAGVVALIWLPTVLVPAPLHRVLGAIGGASLYLYLVHFQVNTALGVEQPVLQLIVALICGLVASAVWSRIFHAVARHKLDDRESVPSR